MNSQSAVKNIVRVSFRGTADVFIAQVISAMLSTIGVILIARLLGPELFGSISVIMILPSFVILFTDWAISHAMIRYIALYRARGEDYRVRRVIMIGTVFILITGIVMLVVSVLVTGTFAEYVINSIDLTPLILLASWTILGQTMMSAGRAILIGVDSTGKYSITIILSAFFQGILPAILVAYGLGLLGVIVGMTTGSVIVGCIVMVLGKRYIPSETLEKPQDDSTTTLSDLQMLIRYGFPLFISVIAGGALPQVLYTIAATSLSPWVLGNYSAAIRLGTLMSFVSIPILTVLFPAFSKIDGEKGRNDLEALFVLGTKYTTIVVVPLTALVIVLSSPIVNILYGAEYQAASFYLSLSVSVYLLASIGSLVVGGFLRGQNHTRIYLLMHSVLLLVGSLLGLYLAPIYGAYGLIFATNVATLFSILLGILWVNRIYNFRPDFLLTIKMLVYASISAFVAFAMNEVVSAQNSWVSVIVIIFTFVPVYILIFGKSGVLTKDDFMNLRYASASLGKISAPIIWILNSLERISGARFEHTKPVEQYKKSQNPSTAITNQEKMRIAETLQLVPKDIHSVLDVGCFDCRMTRGITNRRVVGLDIHIESGCHNIDTILGSITSLPFEKGAFECIIGTEVLEHLEKRDYERAIAEINRVAKKWILISVPFNEDLEEGRIQCEFCGNIFHVWGHKRRYRTITHLDIFSSFKRIACVYIGKRFTGLKSITRILGRTGKSVLVEQVECSQCRSTIRGIEALSLPHKMIFQVNNLVKRIKALVNRGDPIWIAVIYRRIEEL
ncbi:MAG: oligosaccharide flippase family protein [Candidatus Thorarchaeota archaeon]